MSDTTGNQLPAARPRLMQRLAQWLVREEMGGLLRTILRHVLAWLFVLAGLASVVRAVNSTGAARWWWFAGITLCSWSASWVERSRVFNADADDDEEEAYDEDLEAAPDPPASQVPARRGPRQWR